MEVEKDTTGNEGTRPFTVVYAPPGYLDARGYGLVSHLPFIFDHRPRYHRLGNQFLIDVGTGKWSVKTRGAELEVQLPTDETLRTYAYSLANYLQFGYQRGLDPLQLEYVDLIQRYQGAMQAGTWSNSGEGLSANTVNTRVDVAVMFLKWATDKGLRDDFRVSTIKRTVALNRMHSSGTKSERSVESRKGKARVEKRRLGFPDEGDIGAWLCRLRARSATEGLIAETIIETAVRREEVACWRVDTLPIDPDEWDVVNVNRPLEHQSVLVELRYGTKGPKYGDDHGDKIGPEGTIHVPMPLALKLHEYREYVRPHALRTLLKKAKNGREAARIRASAVHLFLDAETGERYRGQQIYDFWTSPAVDCPKGWHPHLGRDFWSCTKLWRHLQERQDLIARVTRSDPSQSDLLLLKNDLLGYIELTIQPQLRHVSVGTTLMYLQWVSDRLNVNLNLVDRYNQTLEVDGPV